MAAREKQSVEQQEKLKRIVRRDAAFLLLGAIAASIMSWMELNAGNVEVRGKDMVDAQGKLADHHGIIDAGYIATTPLHNFLKANRVWNDALALINTVVGVFGPGIYMAKQTLWCGDYEPVFRYLCISVLRSLCGWFTFLPPDPSYLMSFQDFPDIIQCLTKDCGDVETAEINPFLSFFSGHVATLVICANHMYLKGSRKSSIFFHVFNVLQIIRLLATRGHYSIDIIIGWYMAVRISNPAGRLGRYFSRGDASFEGALPSTATEAL